MIARNKIQALIWARDALKKYDESKCVSLGISYKVFFGLSVHYLSVKRADGITSVKFIK